MSNLSVILQGAISPYTKNIIESFRNALPGCEIILSTWSFDNDLAELVDSYITNIDPGPLPIIYKGEIIRVENVNRQIISTVEGLKKATKKFSIKWRTDFEVDPRKLSRFIESYLIKIESANLVGTDILIVSSINTANPFAGIGLIGHISDWVYFGSTKYLRYLMPETIPPLKINTEIPVDRVHKKIFPFARFSVEQWMLRDGLNRKFNFYPEFFSAPDLVKKYLQILGVGFIVVNPRNMGLITHKYDDFIYLRRGSSRKFLGFYLATISQLDSALLRLPFFRYFGFLLLRLKALIFNFHQSLGKTYK